MKPWMAFLITVLFCIEGFSSTSDLGVDGGKETEIQNQVGVSKISAFRAWKKPEYHNQRNVLGYRIGTFSVPPQLEQRVSFWIDIYSKYTTNEGLLHDSKYMHIVYETVSFKDINERSELTNRQKQKLRNVRLKTAKKVIAERLKRLSRYSSPVGLEGEDLRYWYMFAGIKGKNRFRQASRWGRLRFQLGQKDVIIKGIQLSGRYLDQMEQHFKEKGLPIELTRIPFVESSFNYKARSKVGASGVWQFMRSTGRSYLRINRAVDERNDPMAATLAAAKLLRTNYKILNDWPLAVTAYNHGAYGVRRKLKKYNISSLPELIDRQKARFGFASANFYSSFLAILEVEKNVDKYFGSVMRERPLLAHKVTIKKAINSRRVVSWFDGDLSTAKEYNPHIRSFFWKGWEVLRKGDFLRVPGDRSEQVAIDLRAMRKDQPVNLPGGVYKVRRGETLGGIARRLGVRLNKLIAINGIQRVKNLQVGQKLIIPAR